MNLKFIMCHSLTLNYGYGMVANMLSATHVQDILNCILYLSAI